MAAGDGDPSGREADDAIVFMLLVVAAGAAAEEGEERSNFSRMAATADALFSLLPPVTVITDDGEAFGCGIAHDVGVVVGSSRAAAALVVVVGAAMRSRRSSTVLVMVPTISSK